MSICPDHGGYTGDACKKCQEPMPQQREGKLGPIPPIDPTLKKQLSDLSSPPKLDEQDQFTLIKLESASLKAFHKMQNAQAQFQNFAQAMFEKYKVKPAEYTLDMEKLEFTLRGM